MQNGIRINKALAGAGVCSRRQADDLIDQGRVRVNGKLVSEPGLRLVSGDSLEVDGKSVDFAGAATSKKTYLMLHKPVRTVSTARDPEGRVTVLDLLPPGYAKKRLYPVGRLDFFSEGLLLLTDDGELTMRLTHPRYELVKHYEVLVREPVGEEALATMRSGMILEEGEKLLPVKVQCINKSHNGELLLITLRQGINRQIRRMCRDLGLTILRLKRVGQGPLVLGELAAGKCRSLSAQELAALKQVAGL